MGSEALCSNTTGATNVAVGRQALKSNTEGTRNTAVGLQAGLNTTTGDDNTAIGACALNNNTTASNTTAVGTCSLRANTTGGENTALGYRTGVNITTGANNLTLGREAGTGSSPFSITTESHRIVLGDNNITNAYIKVALTVTSDLRDKTNFGTVPHGLDFINKLEPVSFQFKKSREDNTPHGDLRYGFKAQDIMVLEGDNPVIIDDEQPDHLKYNGEALVPVLVNAIKELKAEIELLKNK